MKRSHPVLRYLRLLLQPRKLRLAVHLDDESKDYSVAMNAAGARAFFEFADLPHLPALARLVEAVDQLAGADLRHSGPFVVGSNLHRTLTIRFEPGRLQAYMPKIRELAALYGADYLNCTPDMHSVCLTWTGYRTTPPFPISA